MTRKKLEYKTARAQNWHTLIRGLYQLLVDNDMSAQATDLAVTVMADTTKTHAEIFRDALVKYNIRHTLEPLPKLKYKRGDILLNKDGKRVMLIVDAGIGRIHNNWEPYETLEYVAKGRQLHTSPDELDESELDEQGYYKLGSVMGLYTAAAYLQPMMED